MSSTGVVVLSAEDQRRAPYRHAMADLVRGLELVQLWGAMGWFDIRQRYSRSVIGPFWLTLSLAGFVVGLGVTYGALFRIPFVEFLPYLAVGMVVWTFLSSLCIDGCNAFVAAEVAVKQMPAPLSIHIFRVVWRALIVFAHNSVIAVLVLLANPWNLATGLLPALVGMAVLSLNGVAAAMTLGTLGARFRDLPPLMTNATSLLFFVTPILWRAETLGERQWIAAVNPFYHLIEIVRTPLLGGHVAVLTWAIVAAFTAANLGVAFLLFARFRWRIPYWL